MYYIVGRLFGGGIIVLMLICGFRGMERFVRGRDSIPSKGFFLIRILNDTIQTHRDLIVRVVELSGSVEKKVVKRVLDTRARDDTDLISCYLGSLWASA